MAYMLKDVRSINYIGKIIREIRETDNILDKVNMRERDQINIYPSGSIFFSAAEMNQYFSIFIFRNFRRKKETFYFFIC